MADHRFLYAMHLSNRAIHVYIYLEDRANRDGICWPAIPTIARELQRSESTVRRALHELRENGLITTKQRYRTNGAKSSLEFTLIRLTERFKEKKHEQDEF